MPTPEGKVLGFKTPDTVDVGILETFPYEGKTQRVQYKTAEFSAVCPFSGLPDIGTVVVDYIPAAQIVELKSLKYYYLSYRNAGIYQEHVTSKIYEDLFKLLSPQELTVTVTYQTRGGIDTTTSVSTQDQECKQSAYKDSVPTKNS